MAVLADTAARGQDYSAIVAAIQQRALNATLNNSPAKLAYLCDVFGPRPSGSDALVAASNWVLGQWEEEAVFENVRADGGFVIPQWVRGAESATLLSPVNRKLNMVGLGHTAGGDVTAEVVVVSDWDMLDEMGESGLFVGKGVLINAVFTTYGATTGYRTEGPSRVSVYGAVFCLVRSVTPYSLQTPHTGITFYDTPGAVPIPAAALTLEDADLIQRFVNDGEKVTVRLTLNDYFDDDVAGYNLVAELTGSLYPEQIVVMGGHIDSWDNTDGAHDDGGGVIGSWETLKVIADLVTQGSIPRPKRTIRLVFWTDEECGARGAEAYKNTYFNDLDNHIFAFESDSGHFNPRGISFTGPTEALAIIQGIANDYLVDIDADYVGIGGGGVDIDPIMQCGVPGAGVQDDCEGTCYGLDARYFYVHHTTADTASISDPTQLRRLAALMGTYVYVIADMDQPLPREPNTCVNTTQAIKIMSHPNPHHDQSIS